MSKGNKKKEERLETLESVGLAGANTDTVNRFGAGVKEHLVGYSGVDNETGQTLKRSLKGIASSKVSKTNQQNDIKSQAGFSAEVKTTARENAEKAISGDKTRSTRTDDMRTQSTESGTSVGGTNDQLFDLAEMSPDGSYIEGSGRQLKYVGKDGKDCCQKLLSKKFDKYRDADVPIEVPKNLYEDAMEELNRRAGDLEKQIKNAEAKGNTELAQKHREQLERVKKTQKNLKEGKLTSKEAIEARLHPELSTAKDIARLSHRSGVEAAKTGAIIGGGMSFIRNAVSVIKGDEEPQEAALAITKDTALAAGTSYVTGFMGAAIKGGMQNAQSTYLRALSQSSCPAMIATSVLEVGKTLKRCASGEIDGLQCLNELGENGTGIVASTIGGTAGTATAVSMAKTLGVAGNAVFPIVGGLIGSMVGYALTSMFYDTLTSALNEQKLAREERLRIEAECEDTIAALREYRFEMELVIRNYMSDHIDAFNTAFNQMRESFHTEKVDTFIAGANAITETLGGEVLFDSMDGLEALMSGDSVITI